MVFNTIIKAAVWFPISAFIALGLEHSVANMFIIPYAMFRGASITMSQFLLKNLLPVTIGNIIGGALLLMLPFGTTYGNWFNTNPPPKSTTTTEK